VLKAHDIGYFFYNGGNDSMDTANKVAQLAEEGGLDLIATGIPKTIDNDVGDAEFTLIDHTPGYGSVARYWANTLRTLNEENAGSCPADPVMVVQVMGRRIGYIPAAARLADPEREMPMQIYMPESGLGIEELADNVNSELKKSGRCIVVLSEGFDVGDVGAQRDAFGHVEFGASDLTAQQAVVSYLNKVGLSASGKARGQVPGTDQRHSIFLASTVDLDEAYQVGCEAVEIAKDDGNGWMSTILRVPGESYRCRYNRVPLETVANSERTFPEKWLSQNRIDVTDDFIRYAQPLIGVDNPRVPMENGLPRFTRFKPVFAARRCDDYTPETNRRD
jgi:6-phosphofructokinase 1